MLDLAELSLAGAGSVNEAGAGEEDEVHDGEDPEEESVLASAHGWSSSGGRCGVVMRARGTLIGQERYLTRPQHRDRRRQRWRRRIG